MPDLMTALRNADAAGDTEAANRIAGMIRDQQAQPDQPIEQPAAQQAPQAQPVQEPELWEQALGGLQTAAAIGSSQLASSASGLTGAASMLNPFTTREEVRERMKATEEALTYEPTLPGAKAALETIGETIEPYAKKYEDWKQKLNDQVLEETGSPELATMAFSAPDVLMEIIGAGVGMRAAKSSVTTPATTQSKKTAISEIETAEKATGIRELTSDVLPPETRIGKLMQSQGELVAGFQRKGQQAQRVKAIENIANKYDVIDGAGFESKIVEGLKNSIDQSKKVIGTMYDQSSKKLDELGDVPLSNTKEFATEIIAREGKKGSLANQSLIDDMQTIIDAPEDLSFELVKEIRSGIGANLEKVRRGAPVQGNADTGILKRTYAKLTDDMTTFAEQADPTLAKQWKDANKSMSEFATGANKTGAKAIIKNGDTTPEVVDQLLFSKKPSDLDFLSKNLDELGKTAAKQRIMQNILDKSSIGGEDINPNKFLTQMNKNSLQINKIFNAEEKAALSALRTGLAKTRRAQDAAVTTPTGQQLTLAAAVAMPKALIPGVIQGFMESKPIRNLLVKRKAEKSARKIALIDEQMQQIINESGYGGALAAGALTSADQNGQP